MNRLPFRVAVVAVMVPFALAVAGVALMLAWLPQLPATIATHWSFDGTANAFGPAWPFPVLLGAIGIVLPVSFAIGIGRSFKRRGLTNNHKLLAIVSVFMVSMLSVIFCASFAIQLGDEPVTRTNMILPTLLLAFAVSGALAAIGWLIMPKASSAGSRLHAAAPVPLVAGQRVVWVGHARISTVMLTVLVAISVLIVGLAIYVIATTGAWVFLLVPVIVAVALLGSASWRAVVDDAGLTVRGMLGWPVFRVAPDEVEKAGTTTVTPVGDFGGWGVRFGLGRRLGIITRSGEALEALRRDGRALIVTVDDASTAAGLLTALARPSAKG
ncbi:MAG: DUF1648 domain-containing protein [Pseudolysinimonas sp.]